MQYTRDTASWRGRPLRGVLFDLDGTLLDTAADIALALNRALAERGVAPLPVADVAHMIGRGAPILIERAAKVRGIVIDEAGRAEILERFFHHYGDLEHTDESAAEPYPGAREALQTLGEAGLGIAVVTNKQFRFATGLLERLDLMRWVATVVGGDTCPRRKPDPQPLLFACQRLMLAPTEALMVGDSVNDVRAARGAAIPVVCVPYGYNEGQDPSTLDCDALVPSLAALPDLIWPARRAPQPA